ncbi:hypothetical protein GJW-30_1_03156 [Variibacter gotjawalensis]|uniref:Uncharacterized protein n=1 Tax=Variibacter gotjawalensis TaxID=1333996 RepID=A0A0S3PXW5_9BRAD|nr:hypothetical protein EV661_0758 [Variibacter gotjawalensis]BAT60608.1 hypothetical protein GJW-30_1_03156 [Variibacter gotjawalensis]
MSLSDLKSLVASTSQNTSQFKGLSAAYAYLGFGVPTIDGYTALINNNNTTNFGAGGSTVFNDENVYINSFAALYRFNADARAVFDALVLDRDAIQEKFALVYDSMVPLTEQTSAGRAYFVSQANFYNLRAAELGVGGVNGGAIVGAASLAKIIVDGDKSGLGNSINDLVSALNNGTAVVPQSGPSFSNIEVADGGSFDGDDLRWSDGEIAWNVTINDPTGQYAAYYTSIKNAIIEAGIMWDRYLNGQASLEVEVLITNLPSSAIASAGSVTSGFIGRSGGRDIIQPGAAYEINTGTDPNGSGFDISIEIDADALQTVLWFDPTPFDGVRPVPANRADAVSVMMHELGHALGFIGFHDPATGRLDSHVATPYDLAVRNHGGTLFFEGQKAQATYGSLVPLTAGSSFHYGNFSGAGEDLSDDLMFAVIESGKAYSITRLDVAILADTGLGTFFDLA